MGFLDFFRKIPEVTEVAYPLPYARRERYRKLSFDLKEFGNTEECSNKFALMSFGFALSCFTAMDLYKPGEANAVRYLDEARFTNILASEDYSHQSTPTSLGYVLGMRKAKVSKKKFTLVAIGIRGGHYGAEWASNAKLGAEGPHRGFEEASERVFNVFSTYLAQNKIKGPVYVWICGYSRAGGIAATLADRLIATLGGCQEECVSPFGKARLSVDHLYVHTFAAPRSGKRGCPLNRCVHHFINPDDLVPKLPFVGFDFGRNGIGHELRISKKAERMVLDRLAKEGINVEMHEFQAMAIDMFHLFDKDRRYIPDTRYMGGQNHFLDQICNTLEQRIPREAYAKYLQDGLIALGCLVDEQSDHPYEKLGTFLRTVFDSVVKYYGMMALLTKLASDKTQWKALLRPFVENAIETTPELEGQEEAIVTSIAGLLHFMRPSGKELVGYYPTLRDQENARAVVFAHEPVRYLILLLGQDDDFAANDGAKA